MTQQKQGKGVHEGSGIKQKDACFKLTLYRGPFVSCRLSVRERAALPPHGRDLVPHRPDLEAAAARRARQLDLGLLRKTTATTRAFALNP